MDTRNYIQISGRLVADVEPNEKKSYARICIAHNYREKSMKPLYIDCVLYEKEFARNGQAIPWSHLRQGNDILITGRLETRYWTDADKKDHVKMYVVVDKIRDND